MEKTKKVVKRSISKEVIPLTEQTWLLQPVVVTTMRYDYDVVQTRILVAIMEKMQDSLNQLVNNACSLDQLSLFTDNDFGDDEVKADEIMLKIPLKDFGSDKRRYATLKESLKMLVSIPIETPVTDKNGRNYTKIGTLCEAYIEDKPYVNHVKIKIKKEVALRLLDTKTMGFHRYLKEVVFSTKNKYVQRFYMFISSWKKNGSTPNIKVDEIRKMLRLENKYPRWDMFYTKVIEGAMIELREKADRGETDCYFTVEKIYKNGQKRGEPDALRFIILKSKAGEEASDIMGLKSQKIKIQEFLKNNLAQSLANINGIVAHVNPDNVNEFNTFLSELNAKVTQQGDKIKDLRSWAYTSCMRFFSEWKERQDELEKQRSQPIVKQTVQANATKREQKEEEIFLSEADLSRWNHFLEVIGSEIPAESFAVWFNPDNLKFVSYVKDGNGTMTLIVSIPSPFYYDMLESEFTKVMRKALDIAFVPGCNLQYYVRKQ